VCRRAETQLHGTQTRDTSTDDLRENADFSIHFNCEQDWNEIDESGPQSAKRFTPIIPTIPIFQGIVIDLSSDPENATFSIQFNPIVSPYRMKLTTVLRPMKRNKPNNLHVNHRTHRN
jgi:hypothetical protein